MRKTAARAACAVVIATLVPVAAFAYVTRGGSGAVVAQAAGMPAGIQPAASVLGRNVQLRWVPSRFDDAVAVERYAVRGVRGNDEVALDCPGTVAGDGLVQPCSATGLDPGSWVFSVVPKQYLWEGGASPAVVAVVPSPELLLSPAATTEGATLTGHASAFLAGDAVTLHWQSTTGPALGEGVVVGADGHATLTGTVPLGTPRGEYAVFVVGTSGETASATLKVGKHDRNEPPVAVDDDSWVTGAMSIDVLGNDRDPNGDALAVTAIKKAPTHATATIQLEDGVTRILVVVDPGFRGEDSLRYEVSDGQGGNDTADVQLLMPDVFVANWVGDAPNNVVVTGPATAIDGDEITVSVTSAVPGLVRVAEMGVGDRHDTGWVFEGRTLQTVRFDLPATTVTNQHTASVSILAPLADGKPKKKPSPPPTLGPVFRNGKEVRPCSVTGNEPCVVSAVFEPYSGTFRYVVRFTQS